MSKKRERIAALSQLMGQSAAGLGAGTPFGAWGDRMGQMAGNYAQAMAEQRAQEEAEKKKRSGTLRKLGGLVGGVAGSLIPIPGVGQWLGAGLGSMLGNAGGQLISGGQFNAGDMLTSGVLGGVGGAAGQALGPVAGGAAGQAAAAAPAVSGQAAFQANPLQYVMSQGVGARALPAGVSSMAAATGGGLLSRMAPSLLGQSLVHGFTGTGFGGGFSQQPGLMLVRDPQTGQLVPQQM